MPAKHRTNSVPSGASTFVSPFMAGTLPSPTASSSSSPTSLGDPYSDASSIDEDSGYDSDATLDLDDLATSSIGAKFLRDAPPLQRMSRGYERAILLSLSCRGSCGVAYASACSHSGGRDGSHSCRVAHGEWLTDADEDADDSADADSDLDSEEGSYFEYAEYEDEEAFEVSGRMPYPSPSDEGRDATLKLALIVDSPLCPMIFGGSCEPKPRVSKHEYIPSSIPHESTFVAASRRKRAGILTRCAEAPF